MSETNRRLVVMVLLPLIYFVFYPDDAQFLATSITTPLTPILNLTQAISPGLYGVVAASILSVAILRTWGCRPLERK